MRSVSLAAAAMASIMMAGCSSLELFEAPAKKTRGPAMYDSLTTGSIKVDKQAAVSMISQYRRTKGLGALRLDPQLVAMAQTQANAMAAAGVMSHDVGGPFRQRLQKAGIKAGESAENIAAGYRTLADAFSGWRSSPGHNANMLLPNVTRFGIATATAPNSKYKVFWAMVVASEPPKIPEGLSADGLPPIGLFVTR